LKINIPELALVVLIGPSGSGKSTFARKHFLPTEIISSDYCRGLVSDDENDQAATNDAFEVLHYIAAKRLKAAKLTVIDATNVQPEARKPLVALAREYHCLPVALVLDMPERVCQDRNRSRENRNFGDHVIRNQKSQLHRSLRGLEREGFRHVHVFRDPAELEDLLVGRQPLWNNKKTETGPLDIIGDIHGCFDELVVLLRELGYSVTETVDGLALAHPQGRKAVFVGDLVDRGPKIPEVLRLVMSATHAGAAYCVAGNHDVKLSKALHGKGVKLTHGLAESLEQLAALPDEFKRRTAEYLDGLVSHYVFDDGKLVVAHAGLREEMHGRGSGAVRSFALYGETTGETDEFGLPIRYNWAADYRGRAMVVYGHTSVPEAEWLNNTICVDTGCVFGGKLTALRYPERELVSVPALAKYYEPIRPLQSPADPGISAQHAVDDALDLEDVSGKRIIDTAIYRSITIREENATAALARGNEPVCGQPEMAAIPAAHDVPAGNHTGAGAT
jgi:protein phosphatase